MCGRFVFAYLWEEIFGHLEGWVELMRDEPVWRSGPAPRFNVAPGDQAPVLRMTDGVLTPAMLQWWLIPRWSREATKSFATFNARSEDAVTKRSFKEPMRDGRCVIPVTGFYEWQAQSDGSKQPYFIRRADGAVMYLAGLWDRWGASEDYDGLESCTLLTTAPNREMRRVHDRMPCVLEPEQVAAWATTCEAESEQAWKELNPAADGLLEMRPVSRRVNKTGGHDDPALVEPVPLEGEGLF